MSSESGVTFEDQDGCKCGQELATWRGLGGIRHIEVKQLWLHEKVNNVEVEIEKVMGRVERADALAKPRTERVLSSM